MADRSGIPEIDTLIEAFLQEPLGDWTTDDRPIAVLADPFEAHGSCGEVSEQFVAFVKAHGLAFNIYACHTDVEELGYKWLPGQFHEHCVAEIYLPGTALTVIVDFTASQYGYNDHPKVLS